MWILGATSLVTMGCARQPPGAAAARGSNLLLVTLDTVRADRIGAYGYAAAETPALDALAARGVRFAHAVSPAPLTLPAHATLLSGVLPPGHGLHDNGAGALPAVLPTLAVQLEGAGYRTGAFVGAFVLERRYGLARGFEVYDDAIPADRPAASRLEAERPGSEVTDRALAWLEEATREPDGPPFFAWVHLYDAHAPHAPPEPWRSRHPGRPYDGEVSAVDAQVGRLLALIAARGLARSTVVAVAADHGEGLGDHGEPTHGLLLYEATLRVPMIIVAPAALPAGWVVEEPVGLADLAPTLGGLLGIGWPSPVTGTDGATIDGRDLAVDLAAGREPAPAALYAESEYPRIFGWSPLAALRRGRLKYIAAPSPELYDLGADPEERENLLAAGRSAPDGFSAEDWAAALGALRRRPAALAAAPARSEDADAAERLAALGYLGTVASARVPAEPSAPADPKDRMALFARLEEARLAMEGGELERAAAELSTLVAADPGNPVFRGTLAEARRRLGDAAGAVTGRRQAVELAPGDPQAWYNLATALEERGRPEEAAAALTEALRLDPAYAEAHNALGVIHFASGRRDAALAALSRAVELEPGNPRAHGNLGNLLRALGRPAEAEAAYREAIRLAPRWADPLNGLAALAIERDRPRDALPLLDQALAIDPGLSEARLNRAIALETLGEGAAAAEGYRDFLAAAAGDPSLAPQREIAERLLARLESAASPAQRPAAPGGARAAPAGGDREAVPIP